MAKKFATTGELDREISHHLSGILYWHVPKNGVASPNQIYMDNGRLFFGKSSISFTPSGISKGKSQLNDFLKNTYHNVNTAKLEANDAFKEIKPDGSVKTWPTYQEYLLSGEDRKGDEIPVYTTIVAGDLIYKNRYSYGTKSQEEQIQIDTPVQNQITESDAPEQEIEECNL